MTSTSIKDHPPAGQGKINGEKSTEVTTAEVAKYFALYGGNFTTETAWIVAVAAHEASPRDGWPFTDLTPTRIGMAIDATDAAARMLASNDVEGLADPGLRRIVYDICLTALEGGRNGPPAQLI